MLNSPSANESIRILVFVCGPLLILLIAIIVLLIRGSRRTAMFSTFSVNISRVGHEDAYIVYREKDKRLEFYAGPGRRKLVCLQAPKELGVEEIRKRSRRGW